MKTYKLIAILLVTVMALGLLAGCDSNAKPYEDAEALFNDGNYEEAIAAFEALGDYKDAAERAETAAEQAEEARRLQRYAEAEALLNSGQYKEAEAAFDALGVPDRAEEARKSERYAKGAELLDDGKYVLAAAIFEALGDFKDAPAKAAEANRLESKSREPVNGEITIKGKQYSVDLTELDLFQMDLSNYDIVPLQYMTKLEDLTLSANNISDLTPLKGLANLTSLSLWGNNISDLTPLANLRSLESLNLDMNNITDLTPLSGLTDLTSLDVSYNNVRDVTPLANLAGLRFLRLDNNEIRDIWALSKLRGLLSLSLQNNEISDIRVLSKFQSLSFLSLKDNQIADLSPLSHLSELFSLDLGTENIPAGGTPKSFEPAGTEVILVVDRVYLPYEGTGKTAVDFTEEMYPDHMVYAGWDNWFENASYVSAALSEDSSYDIIISFSGGVGLAVSDDGFVIVTFKVDGKEAEIELGKGKKLAVEITSDGSYKLLADKTKALN